MTSARCRLLRALAALLAPDDAGTIPPAIGPIDDWRALYGLATAHLVAPSLYATLQARGTLASVPEDVRQALACLHALNDDRNRRLRRVLRETAVILNQADIVPVLLKGAIALLPDQYPLAFARVLGDLDLGVPADQVDRGGAALRAAGYSLPPNFEPAIWSGVPRHHLPPLFHPSEDGYVELHDDLFSHAPQQTALPLSGVLARAETLDWDGLRIRIPALADRLLHNALHHQVQDRAFWSDRRCLRQLLEFARLRALPGAADVDWPALMKDLERRGLADAVGAYLLAVQDLFGQPLPAGVRPSAAAKRAEARFRRRLDDSRVDRLLSLRWQVMSLAWRLSNLNRRVVTPAWLAAKYRNLMRGWRARPMN